MPEPTEEQSSLSLIQQIKEKTIDPQNLDKKQRQECVATLECEGYSLASIAQILKRSEKTIKRDFAEIHEERTFKPDPGFIRQYIGMFCQRSEAHQSFLMRLARSGTGSVGERAQAEYYAGQLLKDQIQVLQSMGFLPSRPQEVVGNIFHHAENGDLLEELKTRLTSIEISAKEAGELSPERVEYIQSLRLEITKIETLEKIQGLETPKETSHESPDPNSK